MCIWEKVRENHAKYVKRDTSDGDLLRGCLDVKFHPGTSKIIPVYGETSLTVFTFFAEMKFHPGMKKRKKDV